jgi:hypothetical protein
MADAPPTEDAISDDDNDTLSDTPSEASSSDTAPITINDDIIAICGK